MSARYSCTGRTSASYAFEIVGYFVFYSLVALMIYVSGFKAGAKECVSDKEWCAKFERSK